MRNLWKVFFAGIWVVLMGVPAGFGEPVAAPDEERGSTVSIYERQGTPRYAQPYGEPIRPAPATPRVRLHSAEMQAGSEVVGLTVFTLTDQRWGVVRDLMLNLRDGRIEFILVEPSTGYGVEPNFGYAIGPEALVIEDRQLFVVLPEEQIRRAPEASWRDLRSVVESPEERGPVYRVGVARPFPEETYVRLPRPVINHYVPRGPIYAEPRHTPDFRGGYPPEYRGGYPPEYRGGYPPEYRGTYPPGYRETPPPAYRATVPPEVRSPSTYGGRGREDLDAER